MRQQELEKSINDIIKADIRSKKCNKVKTKARFAELTSETEKGIESRGNRVDVIEEGKCYLEYSSDRNEYTIHLHSKLMSINKIPNIKYVYSLDLTGVNFSNIAIHIIENSLNGIRTNKHIKELTIHNAIINGIDLSRLFADFEYINKLDLSGCSFPEVTTAFGFVRDNEELEEIDLTNIDMPNVTCVISFFENCNKLYKIDVSFMCKCKHLATISRLFSCCYSLHSIVGINNIDVSSFVSLDSVFFGCNSLTDLNLSNWRPEKCEDFSFLFNNCSSLQKLDISNFDFKSKPGSVYYAFAFNRDELTDKEMKFKAHKIQLANIEISEAYKLIELYSDSDWENIKYNIFKPYIINKDKKNFFNETVTEYIQSTLKNYKSTININNTIIKLKDWEETKETIRLKANMLSINYFDLGFTFGTFINSDTDIEVTTFSV